MNRHTAVGAMALSMITLAAAGALQLSGTALFSPVDNGDFENGFAGWDVGEKHEASGEDALATTQARVVNHAVYGGDADTARLRVITEAAGTSEGPGEAQSAVTLTQDIDDIEGTVLAMRVGRFLQEVSAVGDGFASFTATAVVTRRNSGSVPGVEARVEAALLEPVVFDPHLPCFFGTGISENRPGQMVDLNINLAAGGIRTGDDIRLVITVHGEAAAATVCDYGLTRGWLYVDEITIESDENEK